MRAVCLGAGRVDGMHSGKCWRISHLTRWFVRHLPSHHHYKKKQVVELHIDNGRPQIHGVGTVGIMVWWRWLRNGGDVVITMTVTSDSQWLHHHQQATWTLQMILINDGWSYWTVGVLYVDNNHSRVEYLFWKTGVWGRGLWDDGEPEKKKQRVSQQDSST